MLMCKRPTDSVCVKCGDVHQQPADEPDWGEGSWVKSCDVCIVD